MPVDIVPATQGGPVTRAGVLLTPSYVPPIFAQPTPNGPVVQGVVPTVGTTLVPEDRVSFQVVDDDTDLALVFITADFDDGGRSCNEVVYNGTHFGARYSNVSTVTNIANGKEFALRRVGGWPAAVTVRVLAYDAFLRTVTSTEVT